MTSFEPLIYVGDLAGETHEEINKAFLHQVEQAMTIDSMKLPVVGRFRDRVVIIAPADMVLDMVGQLFGI